MTGTESKGWALVTGASSGIGKALAFEFAAAGYNVFLTARNQRALDEVEAECALKFKVETETHAADLSIASEVDELIRVLSSSYLPFEILVNNAGFGVHGNFVATDLNAETDLLNVQLSATLRLTKTLLPAMLTQQRGKILNVASVYSFAPAPLQAVYCGCKAFILSFSAALSEELEGTGVTVTVLCPGVTQTEFRNRAGIAGKSTNAGASAQAVAQIAVRQTLKGIRLVVPGFHNRVFVWIARRLPLTIVTRFVKLINNARGVNV